MLLKKIKLSIFELVGKKRRFWFQWDILHEVHFIGMWYVLFGLLMHTFIFLACVEQMEIENDDLLGNNAIRQNENVQNNIRQEAGHAEQSLGNLSIYILSCYSFSGQIALLVDRFNQRSIPGFLRQNIRHNVDHVGISIDASRPSPSNSAGINPNSASAARDGIEAVNQNINPAQAGIQHQGMSQQTLLFQQNLCSLELALLKIMLK